MTLKQNRFFIFLLATLTTLSTEIFGQQMITGITVDSLSGEIIPGVNIYDSKSNKHTVSNENGEFKIVVEKIPVTLVFSHVGYKKTIVMINSTKVCKVFLSMHLIQLPDAQTGNPALTILNGVIQKALSDTAARHHFKAFYQKVSGFNGKYTKLHEMFLNVSWGQKGVEQWEPTNVRYAQMNEQKFNHLNMTFFSFLNSAVFHDHVNFPINSTDIAGGYTFKIKYYMNAGTDEEVAVISFKNKPEASGKVMFEGEVFVKTQKDIISRLSGTYSYPESGKWLHKTQVEVNFKESSDGFSIFDNLYIYEKRDQKGSFKNSFEKVWLIFDKEIRGFGKGTVYPAFLKDDLKALKTSQYDASFWEKNMPLKHTKLEEEVIRYFEKKRQFSSNF